MSEGLKLPFEDVSDSLRLENEFGSKGAKKLMTSFYTRKEELKDLIKDRSLTKETRLDLKLELQIVNSAIQEYEKST